MDSGEKEKFKPEKKCGESIDYCSVPCNWGYVGGEGFIHPDISDPSCVSASMVDSFGPALWGQSSGLKGFGVSDVNAQNAASMGWNSPMIGGGGFLPNAAGMVTQSLSELPTDPAFIERAAKFSCFGGMMNPYGFHGSMDLYSNDGGMVQAQTGIVSAGEPSKGTSSCIDRRLNEKSPLKGSESLASTHDEPNQGIAGSSNESDDCEDDTSVLDRNNRDQSAKNPSSKKRKRDSQDKEHEKAKETRKSSKATNDDAETHLKRNHNVSPTSNKTAGKQANQGSLASDAPKEEYIHVRARRGQATNSHSLAERVRREKISERMKFLQDLVPGCNKVTGKAVMLDEIINYVQSLQRQVEFLSMKLATVNPRLDLSIEGPLTKDILQPRCLPSSTLAFSPDLRVGLPLVHQSQPTLPQPAFPSTDAHSDVLRRTIRSHMTPISGGFKDPAQVSSTWHDELHNLVQTTYEATVPHDI